MTPTTISAEPTIRTIHPGTPSIPHTDANTAPTTIDRGTDQNRCLGSVVMASSPFEYSAFHWSWLTVLLGTFAWADRNRPCSQNHAMMWAIQRIGPAMKVDLDDHPI